MSDASDTAAPATEAPRPSGHEYIADAKQLATAHRDAIRPVVEALGAAYKRVQAADNILRSLQAWGDMTAAMGDLADAAKACHGQMREWMGATMEETGGTRIETDSGTWTLRARPGFLDIADPAAVPPKYMVTPEPQPDREAIKAAVKAGKGGNWARWVDGTGYTVAFKGNKQ